MRRVVTALLTNRSRGASVAAMSLGRHGDQRLLMRRRNVRVPFSRSGEGDRVEGPRARRLAAGGGASLVACALGRSGQDFTHRRPHPRPFSRRFDELSGRRGRAHGSRLAVGDPRSGLGPDADFGSDASDAANLEAHFGRMWDAAEPMMEFGPAIEALEPKRKLGPQSHTEPFERRGALRLILAPVCGRP